MKLTFLLGVCLLSFSEAAKDTGNSLLRRSKCKPKIQYSIIGPDMTTTYSSVTPDETDINIDHTMTAVTTVEPEVTLATTETSFNPAPSSTGQSSKTFASTEVSTDSAPSSTVESSVTSASTEASTASASSSTGESSMTLASTEASTVLEPSFTVAPSSTEGTTPTNSPAKCKLLVILDQSYWTKHGEGALALYQSSMDLAIPVFEQEFGFGFDITYIVDKTNTLLADDQSQRINFRAIQSEFSKLGKFESEYCAYLMITSRRIDDDADPNGSGGGPACSSSAVAIVTDFKSTTGLHLMKMLTWHEIGHVFGANHVRTSFS
jgi:hypothetical protein